MKSIGPKLLFVWQLIVSWATNLKVFRIYTVQEHENGYAVEYRNESDKEADAVLFGYNYHGLSQNFGNPDCVKISNLLVPHDRLIAQSAYKPILIGGIRLMFDREHEKFYLNNIIWFTQRDANDSKATRPIVPGSPRYYSTHQFQSNIVDMTFDKDLIRIDGNSYAEFKMAPGSYLSIYITPVRLRHLNYFEYRRWKQEQEKNVGPGRLHSEQRKPGWLRRFIQWIW